MPSSSFFRRPAVLLVFGLCAIGAVVSLLGRLASGPGAEPKRVLLADSAGSQTCPAFSPDGKRLAYSARGNGSKDPFHVFTRALPSGAPQQLTTAEASDIGPVWSPNGDTLAFLRLKDGVNQVMVIPSSGGAEGKVAEFAAGENDPHPQSMLAWTRDGKSLVVVQSGEDEPSYLSITPVASGALRRLTTPPAGSTGDSNPSISPDGKSLAFVRSGEESGSDIYTCDLSGANPRRLTFDGRPIRGITWMPDGQELVYAADRAAGWRLWRIPSYGGSPRDLLVGGREANGPAIAPVGRRLAFTQAPSVAAIWRASLGSKGPDEPADARALVRSSGREYRAYWSPDGKKIANLSDQTGNDEIWVCDADGGNRFQLTNLKASRMGKPRWSPDGRTILFLARNDRTTEIYTIPSDASTGPSHLRLPAGSQAVTWSHDGKSLYFVSESLIWKVAADGSNPHKITERRGSSDPEESADGKSVYYRNRRSIWKVPVDGGEEEEAFDPDNDLFWTSLQPTSKGVYYLQQDRHDRAQLVSFYDFNTKKSEEVFRMKDAEFSSETSFSISPDGKSILYPKVDRSETNVVLVENFH